MRKLTIIAPLSALALAACGAPEPAANAGFDKLQDVKAIRQILTPHGDRYRERAC